MPLAADLLAPLAPWPRFAVVVGVALLVALLIHAALWLVLDGLRQRAPHKLPLRGHLVTRLRRPVRWALVLGALGAVVAEVPDSVPEGGRALIRTVLYLALVVTIAWAGIALVGAVRRATRDRLDLGKEDNLRERRILTQVGLLYRVLNVGIVIVAAAVLLHFEPFRRIGAGLLASAGIAGIVIGFAAQKVLGNLLAGIQIAITQPIRVDDVVVVEGEWGKIEDITLTYVIVRIWDLRRLVLPISYFIEQPFQNWTRQSARVIGTAYVRTDYTVPVGEVRAALERIVTGSPYWDGDAWRLHVTDLGGETVEMRAMMTSANADHAWELRCEVREALLEWLRQSHPEALPRTRIEVSRWAETGDGQKNEAGNAFM
ncbi:MAG TPA: mechanosensitive ion channel family protein [Bacteroidetes bacterium]|nr:mechanosensitive ion channel family protein [Bacteroidota bacterium]HIL58708.1 mechanosensitive ion channel family protein [Rhodothermales bacterium]